MEMVFGGPQKSSDPKTKIDDQFAQSEDTMTQYNITSAEPTRGKEL